jgi:DNA-binding NtrC family response regulator
MRVLFLDDDDDLRGVMVELLRALGHEPMGVGSVAELQARADAALVSPLAILDLNLGAAVPSGLDAYRWLSSRGFGGHVAFLTGHGEASPVVEEARRLPGPSVRLLAKPITVDTLRALIAEAGR